MSYAFLSAVMLSSIMYASWIGEVMHDDSIEERGYRYGYMLIAGCIGYWIAMVFLNIVS